LQESIRINQNWLTPFNRFELHPKRGRGSKYVKEVVLVYLEDPAAKKPVWHYRWYGVRKHVVMVDSKASHETDLFKITQNKWEAEWLPRINDPDGDLITDPSSLEGKRMDMKCSIYTKLVKRPADVNIAYLNRLDRAASIKPKALAK